MKLEPFYTGADVGLFSWKQDHVTFMNGPFEFWINEDAKPEPFEGQLSQWQSMLESVRQQKLNQRRQSGKHCVVL